MIIWFQDSINDQTNFEGTFIGYVLLGFSSSVFVVIFGRILIGMMRHSALLVKSYFSKNLVGDSKIIAFTNIGSVSSFAFLFGII
jgi:hypothetical protein